MRIPVVPSAPRSIVLAVLLTAGLVACGSDGDSDEPTDTVADATDATDGDTTGDAADSSAGGSGTATLTTADGTTYEFVMSTCETSNTDEFVLPDSYDLFGTSADESFRFSLGRAGLDETFITQVGLLEGDFDDNGSNAELLYSADLDDEPLSVDGGNVSGTFLMNAIGPTRPHGDQVEVTLDARC